MCDDPGDIDNGMMTFNGNSVGDVATYTCNVDFELIGNGTATCALVVMDSAEFQPTPPSCRREYIDIWMNIYIKCKHLRNIFGCLI